MCEPNYKYLGAKLKIRIFYTKRCRRYFKESRFPIKIIEAAFVQQRNRELGGTEKKEHFFQLAHYRNSSFKLP